MGHQERKSSQTQQQTAKDAPVVCHRLSQVAGHAGRRNDLVYAASSAAASAAVSRLVVYFGGDVQDYVECMDGHRENCRYRQWNLEATARLLLARFGAATTEVVAVRPRRLAGGTYSVYSNFLTACSELDGQPSFERPFSGGHAAQHLRELLTRARRELASRQVDDNDGDDDAEAVEAPLPPRRLTLVGFSKGCAPLNQIVRELSHQYRRHRPTNGDEADDPLPGLAELYWLDGGHAGRSDTWLTDPADLDGLRGLRVRAYTTPYQVRDSTRPWIGREFERFLEGCSGLGPPPLDLRSGVLCQEAQPSLESHFRLLELFPIDSD